MSGDEPVSVCTGFRRAVFPVHLATLLLFAHIYRPNTLCYCARKMSIYVGATFHSFDEFLKVFKEYCESTHQKFVVGGSKKLDTVNKQKQEHEHKKTASSSESIVYAYIQYRCIRQGFYQTASKGIRRTSTNKAGCEAIMYVRGDREKGILEVKKLITDHNHPIGPDVSYRKGVGKLKEKKAAAKNTPTGKGAMDKSSRKMIKSEGGTQKQQNSGRTVGVTELQSLVKSVIPPLTTQLHKGQAGRIGVIGGCQEYTGAPYFAAITALKVGADLSHVFCTREAAPVIKSYSPELIVHPILDHADAITEFEKWLPRLHALVIGPGLGREPDILKTVSFILANSKARGIPVVVDADGLFLITESPELVENYETAILTPNAVEFKRFYEKMFGDKLSPGSDMVASTKKLAQRLGNLTIIRKGTEDTISDGKTVIMCSTDGSPRRCGGQGDLLSGSVAAFFNWSLQKHNARSEEDACILGPGVLAGYMACRLIRECGRLAFEQHGRSMVASDLIPFVHVAFESLFN